MSIPPKTGLSGVDSLDEVWKILNEFSLFQQNKQLTPLSDADEKLIVLASSKWFID